MYLLKNLFRLFIAFTMLISSVLFHNTNVPQDLSSAYLGVLDTYKIMCSSVRDGSLSYTFDVKEVPASAEEVAEHWSNMWAEVNSAYMRAEEKFNFGYAFYDLNQDGTGELLLLLDDYSLLAVFSLVENRPVLADAFWSKQKGAVSEGRQILTFTSASAAESYFSLNEIGADGGLISVETWGMENGEYYRVQNGQRQCLSEAEYDNLFGDYSDFSNEKAAAITAENPFRFILL